MPRDGNARVPLTSLAIAALVLLRFAIGWHFFSDGAKKLKDPDFRAAYFLDGAVGPFRDFFHSMIPDAFGVQRTNIEQRRAAWQQLVKQMSTQFGSESEQAAQAAELLAEHLKTLDYFRSIHQADIDQHLLEVERYEAVSRDPNVADVPFGAQWLSIKRAELSAAAKPWISDLDKIDRAFRHELSLATELPAADVARRNDPGAKSWVDHSVSWTVFLVGVCLMLGLFVPLAGVIGALFLISVLLTQPFWVAESNLSYLPYQLVELAGLLVLATLGVGRYAGLDFFVAAWRRSPASVSVTANVR